MYLQLVEKIDKKAISELLTPFTLRYIRILLRGERIKSQTSERSLLKNLGLWLGRMTLARRKPLRKEHLDVKDLIIEAYEQVCFSTCLN